MKNLFMYTANNTVKIIVKLCKYPVVYLDGKTRVENNKSKLKKKKFEGVDISMKNTRNT